MLLPKQSRKQPSSPRSRGLRSSRPWPRRLFRPQLERLEDRLVLNYAVSSAPFQWVELNGDPNATALIGTGEDWANPINLGSNTINFYGSTYSGFGGPTGIWGSTNGLITFGSGNADFRNGDLMTNPGQAAISPLWGSYYKFDSSTGWMVLYEVDAVNNRLIIEWNQVHDFVTNRPVTFEAIIQLNTGSTPGNIIFNYLQLDYYLGSGASVGIKDGGTQGPNAVVVSVNIVSPLVNINQGILFAWPSPAKVPSISSLSANTASEGSSDLALTVNGNNFGATSVVEVNGTALTTSFISGTQLQATLPASLLAEEGSLSITVFTPGALGGTSNAVAFSVTDASLTPSGQFLSTTEGQTIAGGLVATFTDPGSDGTAADYSATVTWDDGNGQSHTSAGTVQLISGQTFGVYADNTVPYAEEGIHGVTVTISDKGSSQATVTSEVTVSDAALTASATSISATEGASFTGQVATFSDADPNGTSSDYTATINWGDGQSSTGTITVGAGGSFVISGSHVYADEGNYNVSVQIADAGGAGTSASGSATVADAALSAQGSSISATEGAAFSGVVATFTDANKNAAASDFTATISWGDGGSSLGTVTANGAGLFTVTGNYTYAEEGNFPITVSIVDDGGASASASSSASVVDALLSASGTTVNPLEGNNFTGVVASFTDADPNGTATDYQASIDWGDGTTSSGIIQVNPNGGFQVVGSHSYRKEGTTSVTVTIQDMGGSNNIATASSTAVTNDAPLTGAGVIASATEGISFTGAVASFTDTDAFAVPADYVVTIDWGDGATSSGTVVVNPSGGFLVMGTHTYAEEGSRTVQVSILDDGGSSASVSSTMNIGDAGLSGAGMTVTTTEGMAFSVVVATFTDANLNGTAGDFSATVAWGDGTSTSGTVSANGSGGFSVSGSHTYAQEGTFAVTVTLTDVGGANAGATSTAQVADAPLTANGSPVSSTEGGTFSGVVATFTDANVNAPASDFTALITWGDGNTSAGVITSTGNGGFAISGTNSYAEDGAYPVSVQINDVGGASGSATTTANVADAALQATGTTITTTEGNNFAGTVASFTDANLGSTVSDFTATISWGDGSSSTGAVIPTGSGQYAVRASHTYAEEGSHTIGVQIADAGGSTASAISSATAADAALSATAGSISSVEGGSFSGVVASFTDGNPTAGTSDFTATINWGDGTTSPGTISANQSGGFDVSGAHLYVIEHALSLSVTISDVGGSSATANGTANVADAQLSATGVSLTPTEGLAFSAGVASFTDANLLSTASDFKVIISWGDGSSSNGTVSQIASGNFSVGGSHTYAQEGNYTIQVQIFDAGGATATANSTAQVADASLTSGSSPVSSVEGSTFSGVVATFTDANVNAPASDFTALITWGDGHTSAGNIASTGNGSFTVSGTNSYAEDGQYAVSVQITDAGGASTTATTTATMADAALQAAGTTISTTEGNNFSGTVASFTDANTGSTLADFTATISWGDGSSSTGSVVSTGSGQYAVRGSHTYAEEGSYTIGVQITDAGGSTANASSNATAADAALSATAGSISSVEGGSFSGVVASFTDGNPTASLSDFSATINWGDGTSSPGTISANNSGGFDVSGSHSYANEGTPSFSVTITDKGGASANVGGTATVADAMLAAVGVTLTETQGVAFTSTVATFADAYLLSGLGDFKAVITWGDGSSSNGNISQSAPGSFSVLGSHTYALAGNFAISVQIVDAGGATATAGSTANVTAVDPATLSATGTIVHATESSAFTAVVANFSDGNTALTTKDFSALISWGDGTTSTGTISANSSGNFSVVGTYTYAIEGTEAISVLVQDSSGSSAQAISTGLVADSTPVVHASVQHHKHQHHVVLTGSFSDAALEDHTVAVNWGDGTSTVIDWGVSTGGSFTFQHDYSGQFLAQHHGKARITIVVLDNAGAGSAPLTLSVNFNNGHDNDGHHHVNEDDQGQRQDNQGDIWGIPGIDFFS